MKEFLKVVTIVIIGIHLIFILTASLIGALESGDCTNRPAKITYYTGLYQSYKAGCYLGQPMEVE